MYQPAHNSGLKEILPLLATIGSLFLILAGTVGLVLLQKPLSESKDLRGDASELLSCNQTCSSNSQCESNHFCYQNKCRLADNPDSTTCESRPDQGLNKQCDEYCADTRECDDDYICLENRCRRPENPDDDKCTIYIEQRVTGSQEIIYQQLPDTIVYVKASPIPQAPASPTPLPKGGELKFTATESALATGAAIIQPSLTPIVVTSPKPSPVPADENAMDGLLGSLNLPSNLLPTLALGLGGVVLLAILIPQLFKGQKKSTIITKAASTKPTYEQELEQKLAELKTQPPTTPTIPSTSPMTSPPAQSSMLERAKNKGITPPPANS